MWLTMMDKMSLTLNVTKPFALFAWFGELKGFALWVRTLYDCFHSRVKTPAEIPMDFPTMSVLVHQGSALSQILFVVVVNDIAEVFRSQSLERSCTLMTQYSFAEMRSSSSG